MKLAWKVVCAIPLRWSEQQMPLPGFDPIAEAADAQDLKHCEVQDVIEVLLAIFNGRLKHSAASNESRGRQETALFAVN